MHLFPVIVQPPSSLLKLPEAPSPMLGAPYLVLRAGLRDAEPSCILQLRPSWTSHSLEGEPSHVRPDPSQPRPHPPYSFISCSAVPGARGHRPLLSLFSSLIHAAPLCLCLCPFTPASVSLSPDFSFFFWPRTHLALPRWLLFSPSLPGCLLFIYQILD